MIFQLHSKMSLFSLRTLQGFNPDQLDASDQHFTGIDDLQPPSPDLFRKYIFVVKPLEGQPPTQYMCLACKKTFTLTLQQNSWKKSNIVRHLKETCDKIPLHERNPDQSPAVKLIFFFYLFSGLVLSSDLFNIFSKET